MALKTFAGGSIFGVSNSSEVPVVLALHGWARSSSDFDAVLEGVPAISLDLPGFGASPCPDDVWGADEYADALVPVLREFPEPPLIVGHSFGGRVAVSLAARYPELVGQLLFIGVPLLRAPDRQPAKASALYRLIRTLHDWGVIGETRMEAARQKYGSADYRAAEGVMRQILVKAVNETYEHHLAEVRCRTHLLWGANDTAAPVSIATTAAKLMPHAEVSMAILPEIGHHVMLEAPEKTRAEIAMLVQS